MGVLPIKIRSGRWRGKEGVGWFIVSIRGREGGRAAIEKGKREECEIQYRKSNRDSPTLWCIIGCLLCVKERWRKLYP